MRKTATAWIILICISLGSAALAEAPALDEEAASADTALNETAETAAAEQSPFAEWLKQGIELFSGALSSDWEEASDALQTEWENAAKEVSDGWAKASDALENGLEWIREQSGEWIEAVDNYMKENQCEEKIVNAWNTLKEGAAQTGIIARDRLNEAYQTLKEWVLQSEEEEHEELTEAVDGIAGEARVTEAQAEIWLRQLEAVITEKADAMTDTAKEAWEIVKQNGEEAGSIEREQLNEACETLREWLMSIGAEGDSEVVRGLDLLEQQE